MHKDARHLDGSEHREVHNLYGLMLVCCCGRRMFWLFVVIADVVVCSHQRTKVFWIYTNVASVCSTWRRLTATCDVIRT